MIYIKGLELCKKYFNEIALSSLKACFPHIVEDIAIGLSGPGSDCFGFDDEISQDHDWGPAFCVFVPARLYKIRAKEIAAWYDSLPKQFAGYGPRYVTEPDRIGVIDLERFFAMYTGFMNMSPTNTQWLRADSVGLAVCTNGEIFMDGSGECTAWRNALSSYPEDVRKKKIAGACFLAGQSGQYNYVRSVKRKDVFAAKFALSEFCSQVLSIAFLMSGKYAPFYKWKLRAAKELPKTYAHIAHSVESILANGNNNTQNAIEELSSYIISLLEKQNLAAKKGDFLADYKGVIEQSIIDKETRTMPGLY